MSSTSTAQEAGASVPKRRGRNEGPCAVEGCDRPMRAGRMCSTHYKREQARLALERSTRVCECGCGSKVRKRFVQGHWTRTDEGQTFLTSANVNALRKRAVRRGGEHYRWNGGRKNKDGYLLVQVGVGHPMAYGQRGYAMEHRLVMSKALGRTLYPWETVHHKNGIRHDNRPENLELWTKQHGAGCRVEDLVAFVVDNYPEAVEARRSGRAQLRLIANQEAI